MSHADKLQPVLKNRSSSNVTGSAEIKKPSGSYQAQFEEEEKKEQVSKRSRSRNKEVPASAREKTEQPSSKRM